MAEYNKKWANLFPATIGNQTRPSAGVDNTLQYETDKFPQHIANDPVRYDKMNAVVSQAMSNDERLNEKIKRTSDDLAAHNKNPKAHATGISGNAATATKLQTPRTLSLTGKASGSTTFDGSTNASINVTSVNADNDGNGNNIAATYVRRYQNIGEKDLNDIKLGGLYANPLNVNATAGRHYPEVTHAGSIFVINNGTNGDDGCTQVYTTFDSHNSYKREYDVNSKTWSAWRKYAFEDSTVASAQKLATARKINITGNATGSASFDGSGDISINTTVNESKHAATADTATKANDSDKLGGLPLNSASIGGHYSTVPAIKSDGAMEIGKYIDWHATDGGTEDWSSRWIAENDGTVSVGTINGTLKGNADRATALNIFTSRPSDANIQKGDGLVRYFLATGNMKSNKPMKDAQILHLAWDSPGWDAQLAITNVDGDIQTRSQNNGTWGAWKTFLNENNYNNYAPTKTGGGASGTWGINISGNAASATTATKANTLKSDIATETSTIARPVWLSWEGDNTRQVVSSNLTYTCNTKTLTAANFKGHLAGNADSATNADKVDGYHASDLLRILGGNRTPVITDIFDRAGTIDMSTMSAADKAKHKANINKAPNMTQNIWNNSTGIHAYGGDTDISGFPISTLKLTQSWRNFDKLMILYTDDGGNWGRVRTFDVYEFNYCMTNMHSFNILLSNGQSWHVYGLTKHGTDSDFKPSTETILSCRSQNCGIIGIYGIKF